MAWTLRIHDPLGNLERTISEETKPLEVIGGFDARVAPSGDCQELVFRARNDRLRASARGIIQYLQDGQEIFWGPVIINPLEDAQGAGPADEEPDLLERFVVAGGRQLLRDSLVGPLFLEEDLDVAAAALRFCQEYAHPALTVDEANFPDTGLTSNLRGRPYGQLIDALEELAKTVPGAVYGVDASGAVFFKVISGEGS